MESDTMFVKKLNLLERIGLLWKRNQKLILRKPKCTSINGIIAFNKTEVQRFYCNIAATLDTFGFPEDRIYKFDELGITTVKTSSRISSNKSQKQIGSVTLLIFI